MDRYRVRASSFNNHNHNHLHSSSTKISLPPKPPMSSYLPHSCRHNITDPELSIFDAERYFNNESQPTAYTKITTSNKDDDSSTASWQHRSFRATPTASSEASWNSQSGLLIHPPASASAFLTLKPFPLNQNKSRSSGPPPAAAAANANKSPSSPSFTATRRFFGRNCSCYGKKSVVVAEKRVSSISDLKSPVRLCSAKISSQAESDHDNNHDEVVVRPPPAKMRIWSKESTMFPTTDHDSKKKEPLRIFNPSNFSFQLLQPTPTPTPSTGVDDPSRYSLEVFRPADTQRHAEDDVASDASSDLFEIDSLSTQPAAYRRRESLDELTKLAGCAAAGGLLEFRRSLEELSVAPSECYPPSEVSVQWSVTTAEGGGGSDRASLANFSSAASDVYDEVRFIQDEHDRFGAAMIARTTGGAGKKKAGGGLLSCRCENAVDVGPSPVKISPERRRPSVEPDRLQGISRIAM